MDYIDRLLELDACDRAVEWLKLHQFETPQKAWDACDQAGWMTWLIEATMEDADCEKLILALAECLQLCAHQIPEGILERTVSDALAETQAQLREVADNGEASAAHYRLVDTWQEKSSLSPALNALSSLLSLSKWPNHIHMGADVIHSIQKSLEEDIAMAITNRRCADIIRKHYPLVPEL